MLFFFPRVRTPCGHGAQVIVEGREEQSDGGEKNKETQHHPKQTNTTTKGPQAESPPSCSLSSVQGETCETKKSVYFFPRVRTPCGHGAQVIVEGREEQTDGGERNEDPKKNQPKPNTQARRPKLHHLVVFPLH